MPVSVFHACLTFTSTSLPMSEHRRSFTNQHHQSLALSTMRSFNLKFMILLTLSIPVFSSSAVEFFNRRSNPSRISAFLFSRVQITKGNPNLCLYSLLSSLILRNSCASKVSKPAYNCSDVHSAESLPSTASLPDNSG